MKKLLAVLMSCMLIAGALASCGSDSGSEDSEKTSKNSFGLNIGGEDDDDKDDDDDDNDDDDDDDDDDAEETVTTGKTSSKKVTTVPDDDDDVVTTTTKKTTSEPVTDNDGPDVDISDLHGGDITGSWKIDEQAAYNITYEFKKDGRLGMYLDISDELSFGSNGKASFEGTEVSYTFSGNTLKIEDEGEDYIVFTRISGSGPSLDGTYRMTGGVLMEDFEDEDAETLYIIDGDETYAYNDDEYRYETKGNELTVMETYEGEESSETSYYDVDGDKLIVLTDSGDIIVFSRTD